MDRSKPLKRCFTVGATSLESASVPKRVLSRTHSRRQKAAAVSRPARTQS
ncbi:hypothetical protein IG631_10592 [Alternaria alternata]|nr:hypothetical protein IG631_10592 [Alternaria alternata]